MPNDAEKTMLDPSGGPSSARMKLGAYEATEILGRGGMAVVYKGMQQSLGRVVAIKVLPKEFSRDRQFVGRFHREAESVAKLNHPNIIQIIDKGEDNGTCYFVMEYVKGQSTLRNSPTRAAFKELVQIALQVCAALHYAHETGVVHRDIKPGNICSTTPPASPRSPTSASPSSPKNPPPSAPDRRPHGHGHPRLAPERNATPNTSTAAPTSTRSASCSTK